MLEKIKELEDIAKTLEPDTQERSSLRKEVIAYSEAFLNNLDSSKVYQVSEDKGKGLLESSIQEEPESIDSLIELIQQNVDFPGINPASGGHLGYIPGGGLFPSSLGDYLAAITNRYTGVFYASPGAVRMENMLIRWVCNLMGYPESSAGNITSGGSVANLIAVVAARDKHLEVKDYDKAVIYISEQTHHCVAKAFHVTGIHEAIVRKVPLDQNFRINGAALAKTISEDKSKGLKPFLVIASAGTTDVGAMDPLNEIGDIAQEQGLWYHIDAAYGGFFTLVDEVKSLFKGIDKSDSIVIDPHKGLFLPYGIGMVLVKDADLLKRSNSYQANYMQDATGEAEELSPADLSPELSKHFRGLRMWLPLKLFGIKPFRAALEEKIWLARYFYHKLKEIKGFEVGPFPDLSVVIFRYIPEYGDSNSFNQHLTEAIQKDGRIYISTTRINGKFFMRVAVLCFRTHISHIDLFLEILQEKLHEIR